MKQLARTLGIVIGVLIFLGMWAFGWVIDLNYRRLWRWRW